MDVCHHKEVGEYMGVSWIHCNCSTVYNVACDWTFLLHSGNMLQSGYKMLAAQRLWDKEGFHMYNCPYKVSEKCFVRIYVKLKKLFTTTFPDAQHLNDQYQGKPQHTHLPKVLVIDSFLTSDTKTKLFT